MFVENNSMNNLDDMLSELKKLLSPEKALHLLCALVERNPILWGQLDDILYPNPVIDTEGTDNDERQTIEATHITNVLTNLRELQLSELPLDTLGTITKFLPIKTCLDLSETSHFFNRIVPKYIDMINLEQEICESIYKLFSKCERVRFLSIDGTHKQQIGGGIGHSNKLLFSFPFAKFKTVREMVLSNVRFAENEHKIYKFEGGKYSLCDLQLNFVSNIDAETWLKFTSFEHCPNLENLTIQSSTNITANDSMNRFTTMLVSSPCHTQIRNLTLATSNICDIESLRMNPSLICNLRRLEIGLIDRQCRRNNNYDDTDYNNEFADNYADISKMFRTLFCDDRKKYHSFSALEMLLIDFCPKAFSQGYNDISPLDLSDFIQSIPTVFPKLKLLALYGSASELLFNDTHLNALLLKTTHISLPHMIDLSIGFEDLSFPCDDFIGDILETFPNLAWLTLENEQYLMDPIRFQKTVKNSFQKYTNQTNLQWITLCAARKDEIHEIAKGVYVEYWERGIQACDFDAALVRSQQIIHKKNKENDCGGNNDSKNNSVYNNKYE